MKRILIIHPYQEENEKLASILKKAGFQVVSAEDSETGVRKLYQMSPDTVIMADDPAEGQKWCSHFRDIANIPIAVLGQGDEIARTMRLEVGADVYLSNAVSPAELVARVNSLLRRYKKQNRGHISLDPEAGRVALGGRSVNLTGTEFRLLSCLVLNEGKVVPYSQLIAEVWDGQVSTDTLHLYIRRLKERLGTDPAGPYRLLNYRGEGYCFSGG